MRHEGAGGHDVWGARNMRAPQPSFVFAASAMRASAMQAYTSSVTREPSRSGLGRVTHRVQNPAAAIGFDGSQCDGEAIVIGADDARRIRHRNGIVGLTLHARNPTYIIQPYRKNTGCLWPMSSVFAMSDLEILPQNSYALQEKSAAKTLPDQDKRHFEYHSHRAY